MGETVVSQTEQESPKLSAAIDYVIEIINKKIEELPPIDTVYTPNILLEREKLLERAKRQIKEGDCGVAIKILNKVPEEERDEHYYRHRQVLEAVMTSTDNGKIA